MDTQTFTKAQLLANLAQAQNYLRRAHTLLQQVAAATDDTADKAPFIAQLGVLIDCDLGFLSGQPNVEQWIEQIYDADEIP